MARKRLYILLIFLALLGNCRTAPEARKPQVNPNVVAFQNEARRLDQELSNSKISDDRRVELLLSKAKLTLDNGKYDEASLLLKEVLKYKSALYNLSEVNHYLGKAYYGKNDYSNAISYFRTVERLDANYQAHERKKLFARSLYEEKEYYPALAALTKAYQGKEVKKDHFYFETAAKTYLKMAYNQRSLSFYKKSLQVAELGLEEFPDSESLREIKRECLEVLSPKERS